MRSTVAPLEGNKVKLSVEVDEDEFEKAIDAAFRRISHEVRLPGFRPGKAPRRVLESRLGKQVGREEALREALPQYYADAVRDHEVDAIAPPEIDIKEGAAEGSVAFEAVVEIRPSVNVGGYRGLRVEIPKPTVDDADVDERIERLREQDAAYEPADKAAEVGDRVRIDITGSQNGEELPGLTAQDYEYQLGANAIVAELDQNLVGAKAGDHLEFETAHPEEGEAPLSFEIDVHEVLGRVLPEVDDEWVKSVSESETVAGLREAIAAQLRRLRVGAARLALRDKAAQALAELVEDDVPEPLVMNEVQRRFDDLGMRLRQQGIDPARWFQATGQDEAALVDEFKPGALTAAKVDLALRSVAEAESIEVSDAELDEQFRLFAAQFGGEEERIREQFARAGTLPAVRSDIKKRKALDWLVEQVEIVDDEGRPVDRADLELPEDDAPDQPSDGAAGEAGADTAEDS
ncbi:MAG: trigger factor [Acidimicrobiales bacterium]